MEIIRAENKDHILISISIEDEVSLSREFLQTLKDLFYPDMDFVEIYPAKKNRINKGNIYYLLHIKGFVVPYVPHLASENFNVII